MKSLITFSLLFFCFSSFIYGQNNDWITLTTPQSGLIGAPVKKVKNNDLNFNFAIQYDKNPSIETRQSADSKTEYENKFRNFTTKYFNSTKASVQNITAYNLKVRTLSQESIDNLQIGGKYVYEGIAADSVNITVSAKKEFSADISKALEDLSSALTNPKTTEIVEKIAPFLDSIKYTRNDSIFYDVKIKNPNVYYKVKVIKLKKKSNFCNCDWEKNCFLYFTNRVGEDFPRTTRLQYDFTDEKSTTISRYPDFCGKDRKDLQYFLKLDKVDDNLHLWVYSTSPNVNSSTKKILEVPYKDIDGKRQWRLQRTYLNRFDNKGIIKNVYIEVSAEQIDENSIDLINWRKGTNSFGNNALTTLKYPEFKGKFVKR